MKNYTRDVLFILQKPRVPFVASKEIETVSKQLFSFSYTKQIRRKLLINSNFFSGPAKGLCSFYYYFIEVYGLSLIFSFSRLPEKLIGELGAA